ncbi:uncharacterized protein A4U43_C07F9090 [Asparagus officinalis]|uniref:AB hydrolase-1 domain-containing protein n=1 Tax=Asparagus officinalis TaxID=4686 RepID=A0A5P1EFM9_ASPOF|nr:uncharacterized protein A4U43_C07F9090 [Asparagus officinalis]
MVRLQAACPHHLPTSTSVAAFAFAGSGHAIRRSLSIRRPHQLLASRPSQARICRCSLDPRMGTRFHVAWPTRCAPSPPTFPLVVPTIIFSWIHYGIAASVQNYSSRVHSPLVDRSAIEESTVGAVYGVFQCVPLSCRMLGIGKLGEKSRLEIVKNTGHLPNSEDPVTFNKFLLNFLLGDPKPLM